MAKTITTRYDVAEHLRTPKEMAAYLEACFEEANGDATFIARALGDVARAKGMSQVARDAGLSRESLYKALSGERAPGFDTILNVTVTRSSGSRSNGGQARSLLHPRLSCRGAASVKTGAAIACDRAGRFFRVNRA